MWLRRGLAGVIICLAGLLIFRLVDRVDTSPPPLSAPSTLSETTDSVILGFRYQQTQSGVVQWEVDAQSAQIKEGEQKTFLKEVEVRLLQGEGNDMVIVADDGIINTATNDFDLRNHGAPLSIALASGYTIYTSHIRWVDAQQEFRTAEEVEIRGNGLTITGKGLIGHLNTEDFTILQNVRVDVAS